MSHQYDYCWECGEKEWNCICNDNKDENTRIKKVELPPPKNPMSGGYYDLSPRKTSDG